jgi:hypothetical protein
MRGRKVYESKSDTASEAAEWRDGTGRPILTRRLTF